MKILIVTDAWRPQTNGVVTTLENLVARLEHLEHDVEVIEPGRFRTLPLPGYREIGVAIDPWRVGGMIAASRPDAIQVATEGPLGIAARHWLARIGVAFTTSVHTKFPEYVRARTGLPLRLGYAFMRWFHGPAANTLVTTESHRVELTGWGLRHLVVWGRGVDTERFRLRRGAGKRAEPVLLYVGRVSVEKNLHAFLELATPGRKVVVGDGPARRALDRAYPRVEFLGYRHGSALTDCYADADVLVFPSRTDTFGLVLLEAMACGTPVAAYPVTGPLDVVEDGVNGALDEDLACATDRALACSRSACRASALQHDWSAVARRFLDALVPVAWHDRSAGPYAGIVPPS